MIHSKSRWQSNSELLSPCTLQQLLRWSMYNSKRVNHGAKTSSKIDTKQKVAQEGSGRIVNTKVTVVQKHVYSNVIDTRTKSELVWQTRRGVKKWILTMEHIIHPCPFLPLPMIMDIVFLHLQSFYFILLPPFQLFVYVFACLFIFSFIYSCASKFHYYFIDKWDIFQSFSALSEIRIQKSIRSWYHNW